MAGTSLGQANIPPKEKCMSTLTKWNPFRDLEDIQNRLSPWFGRIALRGGGDETMTTSAWAPLVDITEDDKEYLIKVELPEIKREDVKVTVENGTLTISGERKFEKEEKDKKYHRVERAYGSFVRSFALPEGTDGSKVSADYKDGVLKVHLPKSEQVRPKSIEVKVN
jgi:HSP20 family protein